MVIGRRGIRMLLCLYTAGFFIRIRLFCKVRGCQDYRGAGRLEQRRSLGASGMASIRPVSESDNDFDVNSTSHPVYLCT